MRKFKFLKVSEFDAVGGPSNEVIGADGHIRTPTRSGRFVVYTIAKHVSYSKYAFYSGIAWGTPLREHNKKVQIKQNGKWIDLSKVSAEFSKYSEADMLNALKKAYEGIKKSFVQNKGVLTLIEKVNHLPDTWVFNDFGHISIKYFNDLNGDFRLNGKEKIMGDFIHATPNDEFTSSHGHSVTLSESHGCIHVKPKNIDDFISNQFIKKGSIIEVKPYNILGKPPISMELSFGRPEYEVHFYPGLRKILIYHVAIL